MKLDQQTLNWFIELCVEYGLPQPKKIKYDLSGYSGMDDEKVVSIILVSCWHGKWDLIAAFYYWQQYRRTGQLEKVKPIDQ